LQTVLVGFGQVRGQEEDTFSTCSLRGLGVCDGLGGGPARRCQDRYPAPHFLDGGAHHVLRFGRREREAFAGAAGGKQAGNREARLPRQVLAVVLFIELQVRVERGHGEGQQAFLERVREFLGGVLSHGVVLR